MPGDRFIIRMFSPVVTIGGGVVLDTGARRYRKADGAKARLETLHTGDAAARIASFGARSAVRDGSDGLGGADRNERGARSPPRQLRLRWRRCPAATLVCGRAWMQAERERTVKMVREFHQKNPLLPGIAPPGVARRGAAFSSWTRCWPKRKKLSPRGIGALARAQNGVERRRGAGAGKDRAGFRGRGTGRTGDGGGDCKMRCGGGAGKLALTDSAARKAAGTDQRGTGLSPDGDRAVAGIAGQA